MIGAQAPLPGTKLRYFRLDRIREAGWGDPSRSPMTVKILLESLLREHEAGRVAERDVRALATWPAPPPADAELAFRPTRVLLQDFTGVPAIVDLAAMRQAMKRAGKDPQKIDPLIPVDLVIDHSVQVDSFGLREAYMKNIDMEYSRNGERYAIFRWAKQAFRNFTVVPPGMGICHQVNLERLSRVVQVRGDVAMPDTLMGADSHTTMVNGLGVLGWGVGGIEAEAALLGQPAFMPWPIVIGVRLVGTLREGATATDLVLTVTELLRKRGVVEKFVEFTGPGLSGLAVADRATLSNMCPEYGATSALFPVDAQTLRYLALTGREPEQIDLVEKYTRAQGLFRDDGTPEPIFSDVVELDLATIEPSLAGPKRPQDRVPLAKVWESFTGPKPTTGITPPGNSEGPKPVNDAAATMVAPATSATVTKQQARTRHVDDGDVVIAAITSCTNTSNPSVMIGAALLAKKAVERGLTVKPTVKTSFAPGSRVVTDYLNDAKLMPYLEKLGFYLTGYGCTVCVAAGTPVTLADGTSRRIEELHPAGADRLLAPTSAGSVVRATRLGTFDNGVRECVTLVLQDGRELTCTPDHRVMRIDGRWVRADELRLGEDRVLVGPDAPLDAPASDELGYEIRSGTFTFTMETPRERRRTLAFARLLGHLLDDGSISVRGDGRIHVGQRLDRAAVLDDIELITGKRPAGLRYDARKWSIALPKELTRAITALKGIRVGRRIVQAPRLPAFVLNDICPVAVVREFLAGSFGADGHAPILHRTGAAEDGASLRGPAYSHAVRSEHVSAQRAVMHQIIRLLAKCGVRTEGAAIYEYAVRRSASTYPAALDGEPRVEVRLCLPSGSSFVDRVGFRYCVDKALKASAASIYWRTAEHISRQRLLVAQRLVDLHDREPALSFSRARARIAAELSEQEPVLSAHDALLEGYDRFNRLPTEEGRGFRPLHRRTSGFPSVAEMLQEIGARDWFSPLGSRWDANNAKRYVIGKEADEVPALALQVIDRRDAGEHHVFDLTVEEHHSFLARNIAVSNCIGNSGPLASPEIESSVKEHDLNVVAVLSGNRNFEGRIHPLVRSSYLASPPLVVAFALAGTVDRDLTTQPLGKGSDGKDVFLKEIWPSPQEVADVIARSVKTEQFTKEYGTIFDGDEHWRAMDAPTGALYEWDPASTYVQEPPYFVEAATRPQGDIVNARVLVIGGDNVTTDHISPAGSIPEQSPAGQWLIAHGVQRSDFNQYGTRRGAHDVLVRGTFANVRFKNALAGGKEGWWTTHQPSGEEMTIYDAAMRYRAEGTPIIALAGREYGQGSSRDWAAKGPMLLGLRAVIAQSFERTHRANLIGMGILPLEFTPGGSVAALGLDGHERYSLRGLAGLTPRARVRVEAVKADGRTVWFDAILRVDNATEAEQVRHGGILPLVLAQLVATS